MDGTANIIAEAAKSKLGIVALLFVVIGSLARAFSGKETPVRVRVMMFLTVLMGLSLFAGAVLKIETPEKLNTDFGTPMTQARAKLLRGKLDEFRNQLSASIPLVGRARDAITYADNQANPPFPDGRRADNHTAVTEPELLTADEDLSTYIIRSLPNLAKPSACRR